jgi:hypothetical protein
MKKILLSILAVIGISATITAQCVSLCTTYSRTTIPFSLSPIGTNSVSACDDCLSPAVPIGFPFSFMCNSYSTAKIGSNGFVALNPNQTGSGCCSGGIIPSNDAVNGMIALFWTDLYNGATNSITYHTVGTSPNRIFVVTYSAVPVCCGNSFPHTGQVKLFETTGVIELHMANVPNSGNTLSQGIENIAGTIGYTTSVNAASGFSANNVAFRYTPASTNTAVTAAPPSAITGTNAVCAGSSVIYSVTAIPTASAYAWSLPGGWVGTSTTNTISVIPSATGVMSVSASYAACGTSTATTNSVTVNSTSITVNSGTVCSGASFTMTPAGANTYTFQGGGAVKNPTANITYTVVGTSTAGCVSNIATSSVVVNALPTVSVNSGAICAGNSFTLNPTGATSYTYSTGPVVTPIANASYTVTGTTAGCSSNAVASVTVNATPTVVLAGGSICAGNSFTLSPSGATSYTYSSGPVVTPIANASYTVTGSAANGCSSNAVASVTVNATPTVVVAGGSICAGNSFTLSPSGATSYTYSSGPVVTPTANASYTVTGSAANGCSSNAVASVTVNATPTVVVAGGSICAGNSFTLSPSGATSYTYSSGPVVTPTANASYTVTGASAAGCSSSAVASVTVNATPTVVVAGGAICAGKSFTLSPSGATSYTYSSGPVVTPTANASYTVTGSAANGCSSNAVASVSVNANPTVTAVSSLSLICNGQTASLTASGASTYSWNTSATTSVVAVSPSVTTSYTVTGTNTNSCSASVVITQSVSACTGLNNNVASTIGTVVYPNPNKGLFTIELNNGSVKTIEVIDQTGRIVLTNTSSNDKIDFNISNLANGVYYVKVQSNNTVEVIKIVKQ